MVAGAGNVGWGGELGGGWGGGVDKGTCVSPNVARRTVYRLTCAD